MIYFAQAEGTDLVKIGFTGGDPAKRLGELQTGCPHRLILLATVHGTEQDEARWHRDFATDRVNGEWFKMSWRLCLVVARAEACDIVRGGQPAATGVVGSGAARQPALDPSMDWWPTFLLRGLGVDGAMREALGRATPQLSCPSVLAARLHLFYSPSDAPFALWMADLGRPGSVARALNRHFRDGREWAVAICLIHEDGHSWRVLSDTKPEVV